jgi:peptide/nickel transport system substrate-binding protein
MERLGLRRSVLAAGFVLAVTLAGCAPGAAPTPAGGAGGQAQPERRAPKAITVAITAGVQAMAIMGSNTTAGGWLTLNEVHSNGLITSDVQTRKPVGRLAAKVPSIEDGSISVQPDGRMRVVYELRRGITWQDGAPFSAQDLVFSSQINTDANIPSIQRDVARQIDSAEAPDAFTFVLYFKGPYYVAGTLGLRPFWPHPQHVLQEAYDRYLATKSPDELINLPYWTSEYVHLGPFRLLSFDPGEGLAFEAYDGYFLGRPKVDIVRVRPFSDHNTLFSNLLARTIDMIPENALNAELGFQLKERWEAAGEGTVHVKRGNTWFLVPQWRPSAQTEPANMDPKVRAALYHALDREALSEGLQGGARDLAAWSLLPPGDRLHDATRDALRRYAYDPERTGALLKEAGWTPGGDGILRHASDGRRFHNALWTVPGRDREIAAMADYWRRVGLEVEEAVVPAAKVRDLEYRALYPSWESTAQGSGDAILGRLEGPGASAATRWVGERGGYEDPRAQRLIDTYRRQLSERDQLEAMRAISEFVTAELPLLILFYKPEHLGVRKGVLAYDDVAGGAEAAQPYGTYSRHAHLWDVE